MEAIMAEMKIIIHARGPIEVIGGVPLVRKSQISTEMGEPFIWRIDTRLEAGDPYFLCRCGQSKNKPFCDKSHKTADWDGAETATTSLSTERRVQLPSGKMITVRRDYSLCIDSGLCGNRFGNLEQMSAGTDDPNRLAQVIGMVERCPSGSYTYSLGEDGEDMEPDLPKQIAVLTEMTDSGPILSALWVSGGIPIERADKLPLETRNRVTLCRCGQSKMKPLCDGQHRQKLIRE
jgi:CDGSH-type Zn-finger protein